jgi:HEPN domain-containing protein
MCSGQRCAKEGPCMSAMTLAQQAAEKAVKAGLVVLDLDPPRTHNLELLVDLLPDDWAVRQSFSHGMLGGARIHP